MSDGAKRTRTAYIIEALLEYMITIMVTGTFLSAILKQIGVSDSLTGIVSSLTSLACAAQMFSGFLRRRGRGIKRTMIVIGIVNQLMFSSLYFLPFLNIAAGTKVALFVVIILSAYILQYVATPEKSRWLNSFVDNGRRGSFSALKEIVSLIGGMTFTFVMSRLLDTYRDAGRAQTGFLVGGIVAVAVSLLNMVSLMLTCDYDAGESAEASPTVRESLAFLRGNPQLKRLLAADILVKCAIFTAQPFYGTYLIGELQFSLTTVAIFNVVFSVVRAMVSMSVGKYADRHGFAATLTICFGILAAGFFANVFTSPKLRYMFVVYQVLYAVAESGINSGLMNINYEYIDSRNFTLALGVRYAVSGIVGFLVSLVGSAVVKVVQANGLTVWGIRIYAQQILSLAAAGILTVAVIYMKKVILPMKKVGDSAL